MPKYYEFKVIGYYLYFTSFCIVECMHVHASDSKLTEGGSAKFFVKDNFKKNGKQIDDVVAQKLIDNCRAEILRIENEIQKLSSYALNKNVISMEDVDLLVACDIEIKIFELTDALGRKDIKKAHSVLMTMLQMGEKPTSLLSLIASNFRRVFFSKIKQNSTNLQIANELGCKEYAIVKAKEQAKKFSARSLKNIENLILEVEYNIKSGNMEAENALYFLIFAIINS